MTHPRLSLDILGEMVHATASDFRTIALQSPHVTAEGLDAMLLDVLPIFREDRRLAWAGLALMVHTHGSRLRGRYLRRAWDLA